MKKLIVFINYQNRYDIWIGYEIHWKTIAFHIFQKIICQTWIATYIYFDVAINKKQLIFVQKKEEVFNHSGMVLALSKGPEHPEKKL